MPEKRVRLLILCRNGLMREFLTHILSKRPDIEVLSNSTAPHLLQTLADLEVDMVVVDSLQILIEQGICFPLQRPDRGYIQCVAISMDEDSASFLTAIQYGVLGYVLREACALEVITAIRAVAQGQAVCPPSLTKVLFDFVASQAPGLPKSRIRQIIGLTGREQQLIPLLSRGMTNKEIATELQLSEQTVKNHVHRILRKVGAHDRLSVFETYQRKALGLEY